MKIHQLIVLIFFVPLIIVGINTKNTYGQDPLRYKNEIEKFKPASEVDSKNLTIFIGSSSIKGWINLKESFPGKNVMNCGFGGSQMTDVIYYANETILRYKPKTVFIYEGDNDLGGGMSPEMVLNNAKKLINIIHSNLPKTKIIFITPKPSMKRWDDGYKENYQKYNVMLKKERNKFVKIVDVWDIMLDKRGMPKEELFKPDRLHMTEAGYALWTKKMKKFVH